MSQPRLLTLPHDATVEERQHILQQIFSPQELKELFTHSLDENSVAAKNCENMIGSVEIPVGVAGPVEIAYNNSVWPAYFPLATTEGALVASVNRGCKALRAAGPISVIVEKGGMTRSPVFACPDGKSAVQFRNWFEDHIDQVREIAESTSSHLRLLSHQTWIRGRYVYVRFAFDTDQAMGMNMVTIALQEALAEALHRHPEIQLVSLSSNVCTDKKDSVMNSILGRGYWVQAEVRLSANILQKILKTSAQNMSQVHVRKNLIGSNLAGSFSQNAHVANVLSALYIATGQDPAHVVEGSKAFLLIEEDSDGGIYAAITLPNIQVGVVGGGTGITQQRQARKLLRPKKNISAEELAATIGVAALAGELSLIAALAEHQLSYAHQKLGRAHA
ncbi:hydroxymethylglutaryl-CoA reductase [Candidatus Woesebacteria bacterium]|nr:hydroxymethylglutaryl-CoA reductase [Candidatus Woesebacteria bacterium]MCD8507689.1 hydroxymethylglutaryl-CoA reductase [Candidatus Woesebacteria bacterium]MCD8526727.1 hydroxymethylglutaryl-CoA reductase [Candidatus Woesebacteria bacterium]MCD8546531.1 hydroxymethylglutaryl-CoA reductase [Candidatus Woesebacteria bacterium]